jgi:Ca2+-binding RTX toxin-like protein
MLELGRGADYSGVGGRGADVIYGGEGDDVLGVANSGGGGGNYSYTEARVFADPGNDTYRGGPGKDTLGFSEGNDVLNGGPDRDEASYYNPRREAAPFYVNLSAGTSSGLGRDRISRVENLTAFGLNSIFLVGDGRRNHLVGSTSADGSGVATFQGKRGPDLIITVPGSNLGEAGPARFSGGTGKDVLEGGCTEIPAVTNVMRGGRGSDRLDGSCGPDALFGNAGDDRLFGHAENDSLDGGSGSNTNDGGFGSDRCVDPTISEGARHCEA